MPTSRRSFAVWPTNAGRGLTIDDNGIEGDAPLRAELLSSEQMEEHGRFIAGEHTIAPGKSSDSLLQRLTDNEDVLRGSCALLANAIKAGHRITPAGEWLLDNLYLIDDQIAFSGTLQLGIAAPAAWRIGRITARL